MKIHPSAIVHREAVLGEGVEIGPFVVIEGPARIGDGCIIEAHAIIGGHVLMGRENIIGYGAIVGGDPQDFAFKREIHSGVRIGDRNRIREYATIHRGTTEGSATVIGNDCYLMAGAHLAHNVRLGDSVVIANNALLGGYVEVGDRVFMGGGSVFHQHTRVGRLVITQGLSGFSKYIPPFTVGAEVNTVAGLNVVGLRRAGFSAEKRQEIKHIFQLFYTSGRNVTQAIAAAAEHPWGEEAREFLDFVVSAKKRGICGFIGSTRGSEEE
jgi:UDP-N-acetylglucosamine acyltransferase